MSDRSHTASTSVAALLAALVIFSAVAPMAALAAPGGMTTVPDSNITQDVPDGETVPVSAADLEGNVLASSGHADTMEVVVTTPEHADEVMGTDSNVIGSGEMAIVFRDSTDHESREVAVDAGLLRDALGYSPEMIRGTHSSGDTWRSEAVYEDGYLSMQIESWSSNTITFSGEVVISGTYTDGSETNYDVSSIDAVSDFSINVTGTTATEWDNETASALSPSGSTPISIAGDLSPTGPASGSPRLSVTDKASAGYNPVTVQGDGEALGPALIAGDDLNDNVEEAEVRVRTNEDVTTDKIMIPVYDVKGSDYGATVDVRLVQGTPDGTYGDGQQIATWDPDWSQSNQTISLDESVTFQANTDYTLEFITESSDIDGTNDRLYIEMDDSASNTWWTSQGTARDEYANVVVDPELTASSLSVSDGNGLSKSLGDFSDGETKSVAFDVTTSSSELNFSGSGGGSLSATLEVRERAQTADPSVEVNGHSTSYSGTLADGSTASLSVNDSWIESTNSINVSVGDGTLSADAPTPAVNLNYRHDAQDKQSVNYSANKWSEEYNISRAYADASSNAALTIPHDGNVVAVKSVETQINGNGWSSTSDYTLDGTTLTVNIGSVSSGDTVQVRTSGRRVAVAGGSITVIEPTVKGNRLDTKIRLDTWDEGDHIGLGGSPDARKIHYTYNDPGGEYVRIESNGVQQLYLPNGADGSEMRVSTIPVQADVKSGAARFEVPDPSSTEPEFRVKPGSASGDTVEYTFVDAADDQKYSLYSVSQGVVRDSGTANSPLTLEDDDSEETLMFKQEDSANSSSGDASIMGPIQQPTGDGPLNSVPVILLAYVGALIALYIVDQGGTLAVRNPIPSMVPFVGGRRVRIPLPGSQGPLFWGGTSSSSPSRRRWRSSPAGSTRTPARSSRSSATSSMPCSASWQIGSVG